MNNQIYVVFDNIVAVLMAATALLVIIGPAIWVFYDANKIGISKKNEPNSFGDLNTPFGWLFVNIITIYLALPVYLYKRRQFRRWQSEVLIKESINTKETPIRQVPTHNDVPANTNINEPSPLPSAQPNEALTKLIMMKERGVLSEAEFQIKKKELGL